MKILTFLILSTISAQLQAQSYVCGYDFVVTATDTNLAAKTCGDSVRYATSQAKASCAIQISGESAELLDYDVIDCVKVGDYAYQATIKGYCKKK